MRTFPIVGSIDKAALPKASALDPARRFSDDFAGACVRKVEVVRSPTLDRKADPEGGTRIWLALEYLQITGSFKVRGALHAMSQRKRAGIKSVVAVSAGNHGAGVSFACGVLGMDATVVVPHTAPKVKRDKIAAYGARVVLAESAHYDGAEMEAKDLARETGAPFLSPYDDVDVVIGNGASLGFEIVRGLGGVPDALIAPFGGGGLATGLAWALEDECMMQGRGDRRVWGAQTELSPSMLLSLEKNEAVETYVPSRPTLAEGLEGGISKSAFARARAVVAGIVVASEDQIAIAMQYAEKELGSKIEGSAGVALAPVLTGLPAQMRGGDVVIVLTGRNVDANNAAYTTKHGDAAPMP